MAKNWYPIIDYEKCTSCLSCVEFCPHGVYGVKDAKPVVINPDECVEFCRSCQKGACQNDAITFLGDEKGEKKNG
ncbi:MAG: 4Fe-4S dicluster domain-containing protein [Bacillota bacterium]